MSNQSLSLLLDTNVYILGATDPNSAEGQILTWLEQGDSTLQSIELLISEPLIDQITRVAKRLVHKDWAGQIIQRSLSYPNIRYVAIEDDDIEYWLTQGTIPREDIEIYLTAKTGHAKCFVSANHKLLKALVQQTQEFECLTPAVFVQKYVS